MVQGILLVKIVKLHNYDFQMIVLVQTNSDKTVPSLRIYNFDININKVIVTLIS